jgi:AraC-like DNA-binding protein
LWHFVNEKQICNFCCQSVFVKVLRAWPLFQSNNKLVPTMTKPMHLRFTTQDPEVMTANLAAGTPGTTIEKRHTGPFSASVDAVLLGGLSLIRISTRNIRVLTSPSSDLMTLTIPLRAGFEIDRNRHCDHYDRTCAHLHNTQRKFDLSSAKTSVLVANCDNSFLMAEASKFGDGEQKPVLDLSKRVSLFSERGAQLWRASHSLWMLASGEQGSPVSDLAIAAGEKELASAILLAAGIDNGPPLSAIGQELGVAALKRVKCWIVANLGQPITRADLCAVSGLQLRALTRAFANLDGGSPMRFVKDRRLDAVYRTLLGSEPGEITVTHVATDFGFYHLSRFAVDYYAAFGEHPSETLSS